MSGCADLGPLLVGPKKPKTRGPARRIRSVVSIAAFEKKSCYGLTVLRIHEILLKMGTVTAHAAENQAVGHLCVVGAKPPRQL